MHASARRHARLMALIAATLAVVGLPTTSAAQKSDERLRTGQAPETRLRELPLSVRNVAATLRAMGRDDVADQMTSDFQRGRIQLGDPGSRAITAPPVIIPGVTNRSHNVMTLEARQLEVECNTYRTDQNPVQDGTMNWALTVVHEYVHMGQDNPQQEPRHENAGWWQAIHENESWMRRVMSQTSAAEKMPNSPEKIARLRELNRQLELLQGVQVGTVNSLQSEISEGHVGRDVDWPTVDGGSTRDPGVIVQRSRRLIDTHIQNTRTTIARVERELQSGGGATTGGGITTGGGGGATTAGGATTGGGGGATTGSGTAGGPSEPPKKRRDIFGRINDLGKKAGKFLDDANKALAAQNAQAAAGGATADGATAGAAAAGAGAAGAAVAGAGGATTLTLELPGYWGHLNYTITGAKLEPPTGSDRGNVGGRQYVGTFSGSTLTVSGTAVSDNESSGPGSGDYYELIVEVNAGKEHQYVGYIAPRGERLNRGFNLSIPIPPGATSGNFTISLLEQNRRYGPHGWVVTGSLKR